MTSLFARYHSGMAVLTEALAAKRDRLLERLAEYGSCAVAFSGGVDSAVVAKAAQLALGDAAVVVTGTSAALAEGELDEARALAELIGVRHVVISTEEFANPDYVANRPGSLLPLQDRSFTPNSTGWRSGSAWRRSSTVRTPTTWATIGPACGRPANMPCAARWPNVDSRRRTCANWRRIGNCRSPTSRRRPASPAASPMARR